jgi:hypothetical protein
MDEHGEPAKRRRVVSCAQGDRLARALNRIVGPRAVDLPVVRPLQPPGAPRVTVVQPSDPPPLERLARASGTGSPVTFVRLAGVAPPGTTARITTAPAESSTGRATDTRQRGPVDAVPPSAATEASAHRTTPDTGAPRATATVPVVAEATQRTATGGTATVADGAAFETSRGATAVGATRETAAMTASQEAAAVDAKQEVTVTGETVGATQPADGEAMGDVAYPWLTCPVCLEYFVHPMAAPCGHVVCLPDVETIYHHQESEGVQEPCPCCRAPHERRAWRPAVNLRDAVHHLMPEFAREAEATADARRKHRQALAALGWEAAYGWGHSLTPTNAHEMAFVERVAAHIGRYTRSADHGGVIERLAVICAHVPHITSAEVYTCNVLGRAWAAVSRCHVRSARLTLQSSRALVTITYCPCVIDPDGDDCRCNLSVPP